MVRASKRSTKLSAEEAHSLPPVEDALVPEPEEDNSSPGEHSFIYSPSRRRTRGELSIRLPICLSIHSSMMIVTLCCVCVSGHRAQSPGQSEESSAPATRSRRRVKDVAPQVGASAYEVHTFSVDESEHN